MELDISLLRPWSFGYAAQNKALDSYMLEVVPTEKLPYLDGELTADTFSVEDQGIDSSDETYTSKVDSSNCVPCKWLPFGSNRLYPPDVRRGERVQIYRFGDTDEYYWKELGLDDGLRKLETVVYVFSNNRNETINVITPENSYSIEVSTHKKHMTIRTTKSDGEPYAYIAQINTAEGAFTVTDDIGNYMQIDSSERLVQLVNADGSYHKVHKKDLKSYAPNNLEVKVGNDIKMEAGKNVDIKAGSNINVKGEVATVIEGAVSKIELNAAHAMMTNGVAIVDLVGPIVKSN